MLTKLFLLGAAGALGAVARFTLSGIVQRFFPGDFPAGTMAVNVFGCFLAGLLWALCRGRLNISPETNIIVFTGFLGAFTTFSTYMIETGALAQNAQWGKVAFNVIFQNSAGAAALFAGTVTARIV